MAIYFHALLVVFSSGLKDNANNLNLTGVLPTFAKGLSVFVTQNCKWVPLAGSALALKKWIHSLLIKQNKNYFSRLMLPY